ncbi:MAG: DUF3617 domain-containing protein [Thiobacillus sp.]|nr:DUF3617 domain-containing protein [Thiobacillus sp.]
MMRCAVCVAVLAMGGVGMAAASEPAPGLYEVEMRMSLPGMPMQMPAMQFRNCLKAEDVRSGKAYVPEGGECKLSDLQQRGSKVSYRFRCVSEGRTLVGEASGSSHAAGYEMTMKGAFQPAMDGVSAFVQTLRARRIGNCK